MYYTSYQDYLSSSQWREKARRRLQIDNFCCQMCGSRGSSANRLEIHHLSYKNIYQENPYRDLVTLCHVCHRSIHCVMNRITDESGRRGWKDSLPNLMEPEPVTDFDFE